MQLYTMQNTYIALFKHYNNKTNVNIYVNINKNTFFTIQQKKIIILHVNIYITYITS